MWIVNGWSLFGWIRNDGIGFFLQGILIRHDFRWAGWIIYCRFSGLNYWLVVCNVSYVLCFHSVGNFIIPTDFHPHICQRLCWNHQPALVVWHSYILRMAIEVVRLAYKKRWWFQLCESSVIRRAYLIGLLRTSRWVAVPCIVAVRDTAITRDGSILGVPYSCQQLSG